MVKKASLKIVFRRHLLLETSKRVAFWRWNKRGAGGRRGPCFLGTDRQYNAFAHGVVLESPLLRTGPGGGTTVDPPVIMLKVR